MRSIVRATVALSMDAIQPRGIYRFWTPAVREFAIALFLLLVALGLAVGSSSARRAGQGAVVVLLSVSALLIAGFVTIVFVPRLFRRVNLSYWGSIRLFRVTRRGGFFIFLVVLIALSTFNTGNNLLVLVLSLLLAALLVSGMVSNLVLHGVRVTLNLPDSIHAGQKVVSILSVHNDKVRLPSFALILRGEGGPDSDATDFFAQEKLIPYVQPRSSLTVRMESTFFRRGVYPLTSFQVRTKFPFGFFFRGRVVEAEGRITVYPALLELRPLLRRFPVFYGPVARERQGSGSGLYNIRDYHGGDESRHIHWKSTAKLGRLMTKEFADESDDSIQLVLSTYLPERSDHSLAAFERVVSYIASLAHFYRQQGVPFLFYSGEFEQSANGRQEGAEGLLEYLAWVQPSERFLLDPRHITRSGVVMVAGRSCPLQGFPLIDFLKL